MVRAFVYLIFCPMMAPIRATYGFLISSGQSDWLYLNRMVKWDHVHKKSVQSIECSWGFIFDIGDEME